MPVLPWSAAVDIGHNRGRLASGPAASLLRVDSAFGRAADINEAWRSPEDADDNYRRYLNFLNGGPWAPIALPGDKSVHCFGFAVDTDDTADWQIAIWNDHGWFWTVYRNGRLAERWHLEYFANRDNHRFEGLPAGNQSQEDDMDISEIHNWRQVTPGDGVARNLLDMLVYSVQRQEEINTRQEQIVANQVSRDADMAKAVAGIKADIAYVHTVSPVSLAAIYKAAGRGEVKLTDVQVKAIGDRLNDSIVSSLEVALRDDFDGILSRLGKLPDDMLAKLKAKL